MLKKGNDTSSKDTETNSLYTMKFSKQKIKIFLISLSIFCILATFAFAYFLIANNAPIINGEVVRQIEYKEDLELDIYLPTQDHFELRPVVVFFHGGAWVGGSKSVINVNRFNQTINKLRDMGYLIISPDYTLAKEDNSPFPNCIYDGFDVIQWVYDHKTEYKLDMNNLGVFGESAGAHIAMMVAYSNLRPLPVPIKYVVDIYGPSDLYKLSQSSTIDSLNVILEKIPTSLKNKLDISRHLYGFDPKSDTLRAKSFADQNSPISYIPPQAQPILIIHGETDRVVPVEQSFILIETLDSLGINHEDHFLSGVDHAFIGASHIQKDSIQCWIFDFVIEHYSYPTLGSTQDANNNNTKAPTIIQNL